MAALNERLAQHQKIAGGADLIQFKPAVEQALEPGEAEQSLGQASSPDRPTGILAPLEDPAEPGFAGRGEQFDGKLALLITEHDGLTASTDELESTALPFVEKRVDASGQTSTKFRRFAEYLAQLRPYLRTVEARREIGWASGLAKGVCPSRDSSTEA